MSKAKPGLEPKPCTAPCRCLRIARARPCVWTVSWWSSRAESWVQREVAGRTNDPVAFLSPRIDVAVWLPVARPCSRRDLAQSGPSGLHARQVYRVGGRDEYMTDRARCMASFPGASAQCVRTTEARPPRRASGHDKVHLPPTPNSRLRVDVGRVLTVHSWTPPWCRCESPATLVSQVL